MTTELATLLAVVSGVVVLIAGVAWWWISRPAPVTERSDDEVLPLFSGSTPLPGLASSAGDARAPQQADEHDAASPGPHRAESRTDPRPEPRPATTAPRSFAPPSPAPTPSGPVPPAPVSPATERVAPTIREFTTGPSQKLPTPPSTPVTVFGGEAPVVDGAGVPGTMVEGHTLRFGIPADGTLQFLPGRLEIRSGLDAGREIRFVRPGGGGEPEVTFGRTEGEPYRHIQLRDRTVSRRHASLRWHDGHWSLENQSTTNPVVHNGRELGVGEVVVLAEGDRIEMGEVQFTYRLPQ